MAEGAAAPGIVLGSEEMELLPAPACSTGTLVDAAHKAVQLGARVEALDAEHDKVEHRLVERYTMAMKRREKDQGKLEQLGPQLRSAKAARLSADANVLAMKGGREAVAAAREIAKASGEKSAAGTPTRDSLMRMARPEKGSMREDLLRVTGQQPDRANGIEVVEMPQGVVAEHVDGLDLTWQMHGPNEDGPVVTAGSVLFVRTQKYRALVVEVLPHTSGRRLVDAAVAPVNVVPLYDYAAVYAMGFTHDDAKARLLVQEMRVNECFQGTQWFGAAIKVQDIIKVGMCMYINECRIPEKDTSALSRLFLDDVYVCTGVLIVHKAQEAGGCSRRLVLGASPPAPSAMMVVPLQWAPKDTECEGEVPTHPWEVSKYTDRHGLPRTDPRVPLAAQRKSHLARVARFRIMVNAARLAFRVPLHVRQAREHAIFDRVLTWLVKKARSEKIDSASKETATSCVLADLTMADIHDVLVRHGLVDGVIGR